MFYSITGNLIARDESSAVLETGGIAYEVFIPRSASLNLPDTGSMVTLFIKLIVREDEAYLVGFLSVEDKRLFESLITVSGIGPRQGLKMLSDLSASEIRNAIISGNEAELSRVKGIGAKTASRIILELKDKISKLQVGGITFPKDSIEKKKLEILLAMRVLGYSDFESRRAIDSVFSTSEEIKNKEVEDIIKRILSTMGR